jgi:glutamate-1-semialdehyde 2,1-aminomutase
MRPRSATSSRSPTGQPDRVAVRADLFRRALELIPGGVNSPVRVMRAVGLDEPFVVARGVGAYLDDVDGRRYLDWVMSWGPLLFGHADPETVEAVVAAAERGTSFGAPTPGEVELAEEIVDAVPSVEQVRLVSSGTEAAMSAVRLARAATGRDRIVTFAGCYHGHVDALLAEAGSGIATLGIPSTPGVPATVTADTVVCRFNDLESVEAAADERLAAVLVEPVAGNMGVVPPEPGFLEGLRRISDETGALLVFDEVITGFRVARGGAQERFGVRPDLTILGKVVGGGLPVAAFGGRRELMQLVAPVGDVYQAGTLSGNPLATAAGVSVLRRLRDPAVYEELEWRGARLESALREAAGGTAVVQRVGAMATLFCRPDPVRNLDDARASDLETYGALFRHLLARGIYVAPSQFEALFVSLAHGDEELDRTAEAVTDFFADS